MVWKELYPTSRTLRKLSIGKLLSQIIIIKTGVSYPLGCLWYYRACCGGGLVTKSRLTLETPWAVACQAPLSMGFSRQEYWVAISFSRGSSLPRAQTPSPVIPALEGSFFTTTATWEAQFSLQPFDLLSILIIIIVSCCYGLNLCFPQIYMLRP